MFDNKDLQLKNLLIGIRHSRNFKSLDNWGEFADLIIDNKKSAFSQKYFDRISESSPYEKSICNSKNNNYIKATQFDLIYSHDTDETCDFDKEYKQFLERFLEGVVPNIIPKHHIEDFSRVGIVYQFKIKNVEKYKKYIANILNSKFTNINTLRFSEKDTVSESKLLKDTNDYINKIYTFTIDSNDEAIFTYDFQYYFNPIKSVFSQCNIPKLSELSAKTLISDLKKISGEN